MRLPIVLLFCVAALPASAAMVSFHVTDQTDPLEVTEATTVFVNGQLVAHFELSAEHPFADIAVSMPAADRYEYALCGRITIRAPDGHSETHDARPERPPPGSAGGGRVHHVLPGRAAGGAGAGAGGFAQDECL